MQDPSSPKVDKNLSMRGLKELYLSYNLLGQTFLRSVLSALKFDDYIRVLDLRNNQLTSEVIKETDFLKSMQRNESITNIDLRENDGFDRNVKFKLSLVMIRNIDRLRGQGVMVSGSWLNKKVLMINETI